MGLYEFESNKNTLNNDHVYFKKFLGDEYIYQNMNMNNCGFITDEVMELIEDIFMDANSDYNRYEPTKYNRKQIDFIINSLSERLNDIENGIDLKVSKNNWFSDDWRKILVNIYNNNEEELKKFFVKLIEWLKNINVDNIILIGI